MFKNVIAAAALLLAAAAGRAQDAVLTGCVADGATGGPLPLAVVRSTGGAATVANSEGLFRISASQTDTLTVSFVGYRPVSRPAALLGDTVRLLPGSVALGNVDVVPIERRLDKIIKEAARQMKENRKAASTFFYRQTTAVGRRTTSMVEAFVRAGSAFAMSRPRLVTGRYSDDERLAEGRLAHSANLLTLSETCPVSDANTLDYYDFICPLHWNFRAFYNITYDVIDNGERTVFAIHFAPNGQHSARRLFEGTVYADASDNSLLKVEGRLHNIRIVSSLGRSRPSNVKADVSLTIDYDTSRGFSEVRTVSVDASFNNRGTPITFASLLYNVGDTAATGGRRTLPAKDLRRQIDKAGYDAAFWRRTEVVRRTAGEETLAALKDGRPAATAGAADSLRRFVDNIGAFNRLFPQEKVYLHFDNTAYFRGETIWFSAYVVRADRRRLSDMSRVMYVELLDPTGEVVEQRKIKLDNGRGSGSIKLDRLLTSGFYEVRAYTRYMLNWDEAWAFSRVFPIFNAPEKDGDYSRPQIAEPVWRKRMPSSRGQDSTERQSINVDFYPEGGRLVRGLKSKVAFAVTDKDGRPLDTAGTLTLPDGTTTGVRTLREGRGVFDLVPTDSPATLSLTDEKGRKHCFTLPNADAAGCVLTVDACDDYHVYATVSRTADYGGPLALVLVNGGNADATDIIQPGERVARRRFAKADMADGVSQLALIHPDGAIVAERMVFVYPQGGVDSIGVRAEGALSPCGKLTLKTKTLPGATFSVSVRDRAADVNGSAGDAATWLLLASDLRGYISHPEYYLEADDPEHRRAADLLMMVQGWRRYDLRQMEGEERFERRHPIEDGLYLYGRLRPARKRDSAAGVSLTATLYNSAGESMNGRARTDSAGNYAFRLPDCEGEWTLLLNTRDQDGKARRYRVGIDRNFSPAPRLLSPMETERIELAEPRPIATASADFDAKEENIPMADRVHTIKEVTVNGNLFDNARAAWESERRGAFWSAVRYDCDKAADEIYDRGEETPTIFEWLAAKNSFFSGSASEMDGLVTNVPDTTENHELRVREGTKGWIPSSMTLGNVSDATPGDGIRFSGSRGSGGPSKLPTYVELYEKESEWGHQFFAQSEGLAYKNRPVVWVLNNKFYTVTRTSGAIRYEDFDETRLDMISKETMDASLDNFKSAYISEDENVWRKYISIDNLDRRSPVTVFLYSHHDLPASRQKGLRVTHFDGYSRVETFQMPDYSLMPKEEDHRRTLYWNPAVKADGRGEATVEFYNNSSCKQLVVSAEGFAADGSPVVSEK